MRHVCPVSKPASAQTDTVCGWLFLPNNVKCVDADDPLADILKRAPIT